jgi:hypothetical protein
LAPASRSFVTLAFASTVVLAFVPSAAAQPSPPIVHLGDIGSGCGIAALGVSVLPIVLVGPAPVGSTIVVTAKSAGGGLIPTLVVDSTGINVYGADVTNPTFAVSIFSSRVASSLVAAQVINITFNNGSGLLQSVCATASVFSGLQATPGWLDQSGIAGSATVATSLAVSTPATTQPNDLLIGAFSTGNAGTFTLDAALTPLTPACNAASSCLRPFYRILSATGPQTATATTTTPVGWGAAVAAFRGADFPVTLQSFGVE